MALDASVLTRKFGGVPGWIIAVGGAGLVYFLFLRKATSASGAPAAAATGAGTFDPGSYQQGFYQGASYYEQQGNAPATAPLPAAPTVAAPPQTPQEWWRRRNPNPTAAGSPYQRLRPVPVIYPGVGGAGGAVQEGRGNSIGSRASQPHAYFHASMKRQPKYPHFTRATLGVGGAGHSEAVHDTAHAAGIHPARLRILNPIGHRFIRVA